jgi:nitroreductase/NAD-dependent dihydropyrimidine dehydrogenase PreA subunit
MKQVQKLLEIDLNKCIKCGACKRSCPAYVIDIEDTIPVEKYSDACITCGHCVAVCPKDAIIHTKMDSKNFIPIEKPNISFEQFNNLTRNRRSIRRFQQKPLPVDILNKLLESVRYIPTAENAQGLKYMLINNPEQIMAIKKSMASIFSTFYKIIKFPLIKPFVPKKIKTTLMRTTELWAESGESGAEDPYLRTAQTLFIIYARKKNTLNSWDAGIASYHVILAAETMGLGSVWNGFYAVLGNLFKSIKRNSSIPKKHKILAAVCLGYPQEKYLKTTDRKPLVFDIKN